MPKKALFCNSLLRNYNIPIQDSSIFLRRAWTQIKTDYKLMAQFRIWPSSESRHSFVANYTSAKFKIHILVLFCCIIIPLYVSGSKYL